MSAVGWIILLVFLLPLAGLTLWVILSRSFVRVPTGRLGLVLQRGRPTDRALPPGVHFLPALRRMMIAEYPSVELTYRAGDDRSEQRVTPTALDLERSGPPLQVSLGDRTAVTLPYTVRFRLITTELRRVHEHYGPDGLFGIVRDESSRVIAAEARRPDSTVRNLFGEALQEWQEATGAAVETALRADGIEVTAFLFGSPDLGRTGEIIQATARARLELDHEQADAGVRLARASNDAELQQRVTDAGSAWRYRDADLLRDLVLRTEALQVAVHGGTTTTPPIGTIAGTSPRPPNQAGQ